MGDVTKLLDQWSRGDAEAFKTLMPLVYGELHQLAGHYLHQERPGHTLQPTALVNEAYLRLSGQHEMRLHNRTHFYGACAQIMRRVLVDHARRHNAAKRGGPEKAEWQEATLEPSIEMRMDLVALDEALDKLASFAPDKARVVELRYFGGLSVDETAEFMSVSSATVKRNWRFARAWLLHALGGESDARIDPDLPPSAAGRSDS